MKKTLYAFLFAVSSFTVSCSLTPAHNKHILGAVETVQIEGLEYKARIDTGADITSLNAYDINVEHENAENLTANVGKRLRFTTANEDGKTKTIETQIVKINTIRNTLGSEARYVVKLPIAWKNHVKTVEVNLRDRSKMQFSLLIGRNWLKDDFVVDVSEQEQRLQEQNDYIQNLLPNILDQ